MPIRRHLTNCRTCQNCQTCPTCPIRTPNADRRAPNAQRRVLSTLNSQLSTLLVLLLLTGCNHATLPGTEPLPAGIVRTPGVFTDTGPRWSNDGRKIALLRRYTDRSLQLCVANSSLERITLVGQPELVSPDRPYSTELATATTPQN